MGKSLRINEKPWVNRCPLSRTQGQGTQLQWTDGYTREFHYRRSHGGEHTARLMVTSLVKA